VGKKEVFQFVITLHKLDQFTHDKTQCLHFGPEEDLKSKKIALLLPYLFLIPHTLEWIETINYELKKF